VKQITDFKQCKTSNITNQKVDPIPGIFAFLKAESKLELVRALEIDFRLDLIEET